MKEHTIICNYTVDVMERTFLRMYRNNRRLMATFGTSAGWLNSVERLESNEPHPTRTHPPHSPKKRKTLLQMACLGTGVIMAYFCVYPNVVLAGPTRATRPSMQHLYRVSNEIYIR